MTHFKGIIMIISNRLVYGTGVKGKLYQATENGKNSPVYALWVSMLRRCTQEYRSKHPTYVGTTCSENFKHYSFFYEWCQNQIGFGNKDENGRSWQLDKDLLGKGSKFYSECTCVFVPQRINKLLIKRDACRGELPIGVHRLTKGTGYVSKCNSGTGVQKYLGCFNTPQEAFKAYKAFKEALIKEVANEYKEQLDSRVYEALMNYEVNEND